MEDVDDTSLALGLGCAGGKPFMNSLSWLPQVEPSLTLGVSEEIYGSVAISKSVLEDTSCMPARKPSSPHSTLSSFSTANYITKEEKTAGGEEDADDEETGIRKKLRLTKKQSALLEDRFKERSTLTPKQKQALANQLNLRPRQVEVWFQNRRARTKLKQKEIDFEFLKRCFETLKEENLRLHKELKAFKFSRPRPPPLYVQLPAATLVMCPSCDERNMAGAEGTARNKAAAGSFTAAAKPSHLFNAITRSAAC